MSIEKCRLSVDGEMLGGIVRHFSMIEIGACTVEPLDKMRKFGELIKPILDPNEPYEYEARKVLRRPFEEFVAKGKDPRDAAHLFIDFCDEVRQGREIELIGVNIAFDFAFFREFLYRYAPDRYQVVGHKGFDILSYGCGVFGLPLGSMSAKKAWKLIEEFKDIYKKYYPGELKHTATEDSVDQALLQMALEEIQVMKLHF